jgi:dolichol-phosphate mannosyltransferase
MPVEQDKPRVTVVVPVRDEGEAIVRFLDRLFEAVELPCEVLVVVDDEGDGTHPFLVDYARREPRLQVLATPDGAGPAHAMRFGIERARAEVLVTTMGDGSDDPQHIDQLARLVERGVVVASASRWTRGGQKVGGGLLKGLLSRLAGTSLHYLARVGTRDATNCFKGYSTSFVRSVDIESETGFTLGIEQVAKARRCRLPIAEIPTIWLDRMSGMSKFRLAAWLPAYLRWWLFTFGPRLSPEQIRRKARSSGAAAPRDPSARDESRPGALV